MAQKIFLQGNQGKNSSNTSEGVNVSLKGKHKFLPFNDAAHTISQYEQYMTERENCNKIRLICQINTICSNVLFNRISEIVKDEGSSDVSMINYGIGKDIDSVVYKPVKIAYWSSSTINYISRDTSIDNVSTISDAVKNTTYDDFETITSSSLHPTNSIRDTQLSNLNNGYVYHCGLDIFNNHIIRSNTFKTVCNFPSSVPTDNMDINYTAFNTIADVMRDAQGNKVVEKIYFPIDANVEGNSKLVALHLYEYDDILPFEDAIAQKLVSKYNGWVGIDNISKIKTYKAETDKAASQDDELEIERPLQYMSGGDFIDMYPTRDLYSFVPKYNSYRKRIEKNWNYCITYPSSSYTPTDLSCPFSDVINTASGGLNVLYFDETTRADNGTKQLVIYSISKHGLKEGDYINLYKTYEQEATMVLSEVEVTSIVDDYIFTVFNSSTQISNSWVTLSEDEKKPDSIISLNGVNYKIDESLAFFKAEGDDNRYYIINGSYVNFDASSQHLSYKKIVGGIECNYYVRIFSKLPNFKYCSGSTSNEYELYKDNGKIIKDYQDKQYEFASQVSRLAFAKNIYTDDIGEVVFTDDIDLSYLHDNLGRPLSTLYFTIIKNNSGYKEWYGFGYDESNSEWSTNKINEPNVEYSHCFGKITCGIPTCEEAMYSNDIYSINRICNVSEESSSSILPYGGYDVSKINDRQNINTDSPIVENDEICYNIDKNFYGDVCCYDGYNAMEEHIEYVYHRFAPAQRECVLSKSAEYFTDFNYDEITHDDYDISSPYTITSYSSSDKYVCNRLKEGYYYCPYYEIPIREYGNLQTIMPDFLSIRQIQKVEISGETAYEITCRQQHYLSVGDKAMIYDKSQDRYFLLSTIVGHNDSYRVFTCKVTDESTNETVPLSYMNEESDEPIIIDGIVTTSTNGNPLSKYRLFKIDNLNAPSYAHLLKDGTCRYVWRDIINNGIKGDSSTIEQYPFTNGAFYVNKNINLYVRRQDPYDIYGLYDSADILGNSMQATDEDNYVQESDITC